MAAANSRNVKKISRSARNFILVVCAMRNLCDENGNTVGNILKYLSEFCEKSAPKREVIAALKRSIEFGIVDRKGGRYFLGRNGKRLEYLSRSIINSVSTRRSRGNGNSASTELLERDARSRKVDKPKNERKFEDDTRRKKVNKKSTVRKSIKKTRFSRSIKSFDLCDDYYYQNPSYKASTVSSMDSIEFHEELD